MTLPLPDPRVDQQPWELERQGVQRNFEALALAALDTGGRSMRIRFGSTTVAFTAGATRSATATVTHGLGTTPVAVVAVLSASNAAGAGGPCNVTSIGATTFGVWATWASAPGADFNGTVYWIAVG